MVYGLDLGGGGRWISDLLIQFILNLFHEFLYTVSSMFLSMLYMIYICQFIIMWFTYENFKMFTIHLKTKSTV